MIEEGESLPDEQKICVKCGFCCDGSLFLHASLNPGERGTLPLKIEAACFVENGHEYFRLPCQYFSDKCSIYGMKRADVCSSYRCQLLRDYADGKITLSDAMVTVREAHKVRADLIRQYRDLSGSTDPINFMVLLHELGKIRKNASFTEGQAIEFDVLLARCNIFEALLIKHFRSAADFEKMMCGRDTEAQS